MTWTNQIVPCDGARRCWFWLVRVWRARTFVRSFVRSFVGALSVSLLHHHHHCQPPPPLPSLPSSATATPPTTHTHPHSLLRSYVKVACYTQTFGPEWRRLAGCSTASMRACMRWASLLSELFCNPYSPRNHAFTLSKTCARREGILTACDCNGNPCGCHCAFGRYCVSDACLFFRRAVW